MFTSSDPGNQNLTEPTGKSGEPGKNPGVQDRDIPVDNAQVIVNDLVVQGSTCTGFDCVNGENFGFDTLRLKENNLRIHFLDTSNSGSFPSNDWRIVANDTSNGGANYLAFEDSTAGRQPFRVTAGAPASSLFVDSQGDVGLGTSTPVLELHIADGDSPALRLEQNGSSGFTAQTWDIAGNEANFFIRDVTNGSRLPFKIRPGADNDSLVIEANGDVSIKSNIILKGGGTQSSAPLVRPAILWRASGVSGSPLLKYYSCSRYEHLWSYDKRTDGFCFFSDQCSVKPEFIQYKCFKYRL